MISIDYGEDGDHHQLTVSWDSQDDPRGWLASLGSPSYRGYAVAWALADPEVGEHTHDIGDAYETAVAVHRIATALRARVDNLIVGLRDRHEAPWSTLTAVLDAPTRSSAQRRYEAAKRRITGTTGETDHD